MEVRISWDYASGIIGREHLNPLLTDGYSLRTKGAVTWMRIPLSACPVMRVTRDSLQLLPVNGFRRPRALDYVLSSLFSILSSPSYGYLLGHPIKTWLAATILSCLHALMVLHETSVKADEHTRDFALSSRHVFSARKLHAPGREQHAIPSLTVYFDFPVPNLRLRLLWTDHLDLWGCFYIFKCPANRRRTIIWLDYSSSTLPHPQPGEGACIICWSGGIGHCHK
ncbi:hypothetical protein AB1N83_007715 [Pleurotus pulmonarius]